MSDAPGSPARRRAITGLVALLALAAVIILVAWQGADEVADGFRTAGWRLLLVVPAFLPVLLLAAWSWRYLFRRGEVPPYLETIRATWVMHGVNWLLPVAQIGGDLARARELHRRGLGGRVPLATAIVDKVVQSVTQVLFTFVGLGLLALASREERTLWIAAGVAAALVALLAVFAWALSRGVAGLVHRLVERFLPSAWGQGWGGGASAVDGEIRACLARRRRLLASIAWHLSSRFAHVLETWFLFRAFGHPISPAEALLVESLVQAVRAASFLIPGSLGAQEGGFLLLAGVVGVPNAAALSVALGRRARELLVGLPGLALGYQAEGRRFLRRHAPGRRARGPDAPSGRHG